MEKRSPHYSLALVKLAVAQRGISAFTKAAIDGGRMIGLTSKEMLATVANLTGKDFYKSMTTYANHRIWQDVYHASLSGQRTAYIKVTLEDGVPVVVIQFKEKWNDRQGVWRLRCR